ncbi:hypothetical protein HOLleu_21663 [Holothuria leucospilota]|uniref:Uncharacterized protein n=1 Tax=Holothuria leucospilota TaxID=206669 RepID=A0A9Q1H6M3_HOLLE|nr:hypothetical protein HOLleu_21663 [Holothuria leucospilota]
MDLSLRFHFLLFLLLPVETFGLAWNKYSKSERGLLPKELADELLEENTIFYRQIRGFGDDDMCLALPNLLCFCDPRGRIRGCYRSFMELMKGKRFP